MQAVFIALGAIVGALSRYCIDLVSQSIFFFIPLGPLIVNLIGGYLIGLVMGLGLVSQNLQFFLVTGFLSSFTTFSTFSFDILKLGYQNEWLKAFLGIVCHVGGSLSFTYLGQLTIKGIRAS